jgi:hypothetical protein
VDSGSPIDELMPPLDHAAKLLLAARLRHQLLGVEMRLVVRVSRPFSEPFDNLVGSSREGDLDELATRMLRQLSKSDNELLASHELSDDYVVALVEETRAIANPT